MYIYNSRIVIFLLLFSFLMLGCRSKNDVILFNKDIQKAKSKKYKKRVKKFRFEYKIVPHDRVSISTYNRPELSTLNTQNPSAERGILVDSSGYIKLPFAKNVKISGLTQKQASRKIERAFSQYIKYPQVNLEVLNKRAYIIGEVKKPGEVALTNEKLTLIEMIAKAGDLTDYANRSSILVLKSNGKFVVPQVVDLTSIDSIKMANLMIKPNDIVYVMPNSMKTFNLNINESNPVLGMVSNVLRTFVNVKYLTK